MTPAAFIAMALAAALATGPGDAAGAPEAQRLQVGPTRAIRSIAEAAAVAREGALVEVDAGTYRGDVAVWTQPHLRLRAVGGRVRLLAEGAAAEGKGIWVIRAVDMQVQGFDFEGARVPGRNGAGIRFETGSLHVRDCSFTRNEMGLLTNNDPESELEVEDSEFAYNQRPDGHDHNLYVGAIRRVSVRGSWFHHGHIGHLLKSRAAVSDIRYNRLTDEADGSASYELEFPDGGIAYVVGNVIQQAQGTQNPHLVSFGAESYRWPANEVYLVGNTLVDDRWPAGTFLRVRPGAGAVRVEHNLLVGQAGWTGVAATDMRHNVTVARDALVADGPDAYHPRPGADTGIARPYDAGSVHGVPLTPDRQYVHPRRSIPLQAPPSRPGAFQTSNTTGP